MQIPFIEISQPMMEDFDSNLKNLLSNMLPSKKKTKKVTIKEAKEILKEEEAYNLIDKEKVKEIARELVSNMGIVFIDEIDKIAGKTAGGGPDISREGVQRDLLPIIEGNAINTKIGVIKTDHILFIAAGAFHQTKPSDLIPELQGRFPIRVELQALTKDDFFKILTQPKNALINQYIELLKTEGVNLTFTNEAIKKIAELAEYFNEKNENIGARRLHTLIEKVLEDILFEAPDIQKKDVIVDDEYVMQKVADVVENLDLSKYIL
jgi:ATP-dependent HslUV protease ATP-binding subunit HslU